MRKSIEIVKGRRIEWGQEKTDQKIMKEEQEEMDFYLEAMYSTTKTESLPQKDRREKEGTHESRKRKRERVIE